MKNSANIALVREVKDLVAKRYGAEEWFRGVGIAPGPSSGFCVRLSIAPSARREARRLPKEIEGVPLDLVFLEGYEPR